jgi:adenosylmethionine-8-amino-7-oxononanoate aminotransferase
MNLTEQLIKAKTFLHSDPSLLQWDKEYLWHPFTQMEEWLQEEPLVIERGDGAFLYDIEGKRYIDAVSSIWCAVHGHNHPYIVSSMIDQISKISHSTLLGLSSVPAIRLAEKLIAAAPKGLKKVFFSDSGAGAVEVALKMAVQYWHLRGEKRTRFLRVQGSYHGDTFGSMSVGYSDAFHKPFQEMLFEADTIPSPYYLKKTKKITEEEAEKESLLKAEEFLEEHGSQTAACIVEPLIQGAAGIIPHSSRYLKSLYDRVKSYSVLFIGDEVAVGFGRTGTLFAVEQAGISPDLLCLGKGLSGGYLPLSATLATEEIFEAFLAPFEEFKQFFHGHTFSGNSLACAAGIASLEIFKKENTLKRLEPKLDLFWSFLKEKIEPLENVMEVRGKGFFAGIEVGKNKRENFPVEFRAGKKIMMKARSYGIIFRPLLDTIVLAPPLNIQEGILKELLNGILNSIQEELR